MCVRVCVGTIVFEELFVISVTNLLNNYKFCGELSFDLLYNFQRWKFFIGARLLPGALSVLCKFQVYVSEIWYC